MSIARATGIVAGDILTELVIDVDIDVSSASMCCVYAKSPRGTVRTWPVRTAGSDVGSATINTQYVHYILQANDVPTSEPGRWMFQVYVELASGWKGRSRPIYDVIYPAIGV